MKKLLAYSDTSGSLYWRIAFPFAVINEMTDWEARVSGNAINEEEVGWADIIVLHNIVNKEGIEMIFKMGKKVVVDMDDDLNVTESNPYFKQHQVLNAREVIEYTIRRADAVTTTTKYLQNKLLKLNKNTHILKNYYYDRWFDVTPIVNTTDYVRIGWAGGNSHFDDINFICPILNKIMDKYKNTKLVVCGDFRFKNFIKNTDRLEVYEPTPFNAYPMRLATMSLDIGIAPLVDNEFNRNKSFIKACEYGLLKVPSVTSDIVYNELPFPLHSKNETDWIKNLSTLIENKDKRVYLGMKSFEYITKNLNLRDHYGEWIKVYEGL